MIVDAASMCQSVWPGAIERAQFSVRRRLLISAPHCESHAPPRNVLSSWQFLTAARLEATQLKFAPAPRRAGSVCHGWRGSRESARRRRGPRSTTSPLNLSTSSRLPRSRSCARRRSWSRAGCRRTRGDCRRTLRSDARLAPGRLPRPEPSRRARTRAFAGFRGSVREGDIAAAQRHAGAEISADASRSHDRDSHSRVSSACLLSSIRSIIRTSAIFVFNPSAKPYREDAVRRHFAPAHRL
jgi:hypothetical protein